MALSNQCQTMLSLYAKDPLGHLLSLDHIPSQNTYDEIFRRLVEKFCPEDPSRLVILSRTRNVKNNKMLSSNELSKLMDELYDMAHEKQEEEQEAQEEQAEQAEWEADTWQDGDLVEYIVHDPEPLSVHLFEEEYPLYTMDDLHQENPYYRIQLEVRRQEGRHQEIVYEYDFLFGLRQGQYFSPSLWSFIQDDRMLYLEFKSDLGYESMEAMMEAERERGEVPTRYMEKISRAVRRKWIRLLRRMSQFRPAERRVRALHPSEAIPNEKRQWKAYYWAAKKPNGVGGSGL